MIVVIQRAKSATVVADGELSGRIGEGLVLLVGVADTDNENDADLLAAKILKLRIFCDENGKMNRSVTDIDGELMVISNFTLLANYKHGNRPEYMRAAPPARANELYEYFVGLVRGNVKNTATGVFGAHMEISMECDGPVTIVMDSEVLKKQKGAQ